jgi:Flp pilus assembly protein CpaB
MEPRLSLLLVVAHVTWGVDLVPHCAFYTTISDRIDRSSDNAVPSLVASPKRVGGLSKCGRRGKVTTSALKVGSGRRFREILRARMRAFVALRIANAKGGAAHALPNNDRGELIVVAGRNGMMFEMLI